ncbi:MAG: metal-dependent transcriptional regulator [Candidatus Hydrothermarchaeota archaeon]|nr:MAG: metal-dependent transcriptional regulator [Candidatus Hydrothermarchaeota archaeon]
MSESKEDYLEVIYNLIESKGVARTGDISKMLKIKPPSVTEMLQKLHEEKLVVYEKYKGVTLTSKGEKIAMNIKKRHNILTQFLISLGVSKEIAERDACKIEHVLHPETMEKLEKFIERKRELLK